MVNENSYLDGLPLPDEPRLYIERQRRYAERLREELTGDPGNGIYQKRPRQFYLSDRKKNLWPGITEDAIAYFREHDIRWWNGTKDKQPSGHMLSSQVACINHLFPLRQRQDMAIGFLKSLDKRFTAAVAYEGGYISFEVVGEENYLSEGSRKRGMCATSLDAFMIGLQGNRRIAVGIEWKYTEQYSVSRKKGNYAALLDRSDCPIRKLDDPMKLNYEPFYQLMRQTLLLWQMANRKAQGVSDWLHVHVVPEGNRELKERITAPCLNLSQKDDDISAAWKRQLKDEAAGKFRSITPETLMASSLTCPDTATLAKYLKKRYWKK